MVNIRLEQTKDFREVENLTREAFWNVYRPGCTEHYVLNQFRTNPDFIPELDFVMEEDGKIIGHVMFSKAEIMLDSPPLSPWGEREGGEIRSCPPSVPQWGKTEGGARGWVRLLISVANIQIINDTTKQSEIKKHFSTHFPLFSLTTLLISTLLRLYLSTNAPLPRFV